MNKITTKYQCHILDGGNERRIIHRRHISTSYFLSTTDIVNVQFGLEYRFSAPLVDDRLVELLTIDVLPDPTLR